MENHFWVFMENYFHVFQLFFFNAAYDLLKPSQGNIIKFCLHKYTLVESVYFFIWLIPHSSINSDESVSETQSDKVLLDLDLRSVI